MSIPLRTVSHPLHALLLLLILLFIQSSVQAQIINKPPTPKWLEVQGNDAALTVPFEHRGNLLKAILLIASDTNAEVTVNGKKAGQVSAGEGKPAVSLDITEHVREGSNDLIISGNNLRVAALLEINGDLARQQWIPTDASWQTRGKGQVAVKAAVDADAANNPFDFKKTFDAYNSWQLARTDSQNQATDPSTLTLPPGFKAQLIRSASVEEGSWVAMAFDPQGRLTLAREKQGLIRLDPAKNTVEIIEDTLLECRGLLYAHGVLYANANNTKALYRLRDLDGDGIYEDKKELMRTEGGVGHGRNHIKLGPDGRIWIAHGNNVLLPSPLASTSPLRNYSTDQVLPNPWDKIMFDGDVELPAGHVLAYDPQTEAIELVAGGFRNPLDIAFNHRGDLFTFDADMERDVGAPWYMQTRVLHVVSGAEFGWRHGTGRFPASYPDVLPSVVDAGLSSPTGVFFGYGSKFPTAYQKALYILDWSYGRIIAVHMDDKGASYTGRIESLVTGRPLNVTDGCIGPDGALWFITGGRRTQSGLYRVTYEGNDSIASPSFPTELTAEQTLRRKLETYHSGIALDRQSSALQEIIPALSHQDRHIRWAARVALEQVPPQLWEANILKPDASHWQLIEGSIALAHLSRDTLRDKAITTLIRKSDQIWAPDQQVARLRVIGLLIARLGEPETATSKTLQQWLENEPAHQEDAALGTDSNRELARLLVRRQSPKAFPFLLSLLGKEATSENLLFYPMILRYMKDGWTLEARKVVFDALNRAEKHNGAVAFFKGIQDTRAELSAQVPADQAEALAELIVSPTAATQRPVIVSGPAIKAWKLEDLEPRLKEVTRGRSFENGKAAVITTQCAFCHKVSNDPSIPAGIFGPELIQASARFNNRDLLDHILNPSKVIDDKYRFTTITRKDGKQFSGSLEQEDDERVTLRPSLLTPDTVEIGKSMIRERIVSEISPMPLGLLNPLQAEQILDLLAFINAGGDPNHPNFKP